jgi:hypothetical protein
MALGYEVNKGVLNMKAAQAALMLRSAFEQIESIAKWLENHPAGNGPDPLVAEFEFTSDEAYALRIYFETFDDVRVANESTFNVGRKMTGLE